MSNPDIFNQIMAVTAPVFAMVILGFGLRKARLVDDPFIHTASNLVFRATMPTLFFLSIWQSDLHVAFQPDLVLCFALVTLLAFAGSWRWAHTNLPFNQRGVFVQGAFRGNCGVVSFALVSNYFGAYGASVGGVLAGVAILLFNLLSVFILSYYSPLMRFSVKSALKDLVSNPLVLSVLAGLLASWVKLSIPHWVQVSGHYFAGMTLPLALICAGATLSVEGVRQSGKAAFQSSLVKIIILPVLGCLLAFALGFRDKDLIVLWFFFATPTAAASFSMALAAGGDGRLAANIIAVSTVLSIATVTAGVYVLAAYIGN